MAMNIESASETQHSNLHLGLGLVGCNGKRTEFNSFKGTLMLETPVFRGDDPAEDESVDEQEEYDIDHDHDDDDPPTSRDEELAKTTALNTLQNWQQRIPPSSTLSNKKKGEPKRIRFRFEQEDGSSQVSSHNQEVRHDVSDSSGEEYQSGRTIEQETRPQLQDGRYTKNNNLLPTSSASDDSETDLDGETEVEGRTRSKSKDATAAEYESALTYAKTRREVITRLHHLGYVKEPRLFLSHTDKLELDKQRGTGKGHTKRSEPYGLRLGSPPFVKNLQEIGDALKAPLMEKSTGRTNLFFKNKIRPLSLKKPNTLSNDDTLLAAREKSIFTRIAETIRKLFMQFQPFKRRRLIRS